MQKRTTAVPASAVLYLSVAASLGAPPSAPPDLTGAQVLQRCERAYKSLKSYRGTTRVATHTTLVGANTAYSTLATVQFVRPGRIRVAGTLMSSGRFEFRSDGRHTWETSMLSANRWEQAPSIDMAIAAFTGVSMTAATTIPAILLGAMWGNPFWVQEPVTVKREKLDGRAVYRVDAGGMVGPVTFWIDPKTFLMLQRHQSYDLAHMPKMTMPAPDGGTPMMPTTGVMETTESFVNIHINEPIAASVFARPSRAPR